MSYRDYSRTERQSVYQDRFEGSRQSYGSRSSQEYRRSHQASILDEAESMSQLYQNKLENNDWSSREKIHIEFPTHLEKVFGSHNGGQGSMLETL